MKKLLASILFSSILLSAKSQSVTQIKQALETALNPFQYVKEKLKKKFVVDTVTIVSSTSFLGMPDSLAYNGKIGKVYGPFPGNNILIKILAKVPNTFYHVSHIVIDTSVFKKQFADSLASTIIKRIQSGSSSFETLAGTYSADAISAAKGGDLGWFIRGAMLPQLDNAIAAHKKGDVFKVWTPAGLHVVSIKDQPKKDNGFALLLRVFL